MHRTNLNYMKARKSLPTTWWVLTSKSWYSDERQKDASCRLTSEISSQVGLTDGQTSHQWTTEILAAQACGIDGFALNIGPSDHYTHTQLHHAYAAASSTCNGHFVLFLSFDMAAGQWHVDQVVSLVNEFKESPAQCKVEGAPFVSTFEGPGWAHHWEEVRRHTGGIFLVPDWSSLGPHGVGRKLPHIDGACGFGPRSLELEADSYG